MLPPELMGGAPPGPMMGGPPPEMMGGPPPGGEEPPADVGELLQNMLDLADAYRQQEDSQQNLMLIEQARTLIQKILANEEKMSDDLMQGKTSPAALRRYAS